MIPRKSDRRIPIVRLYLIHGKSSHKACLYQILSFLSLSSDDKMLTKSKNINNVLSGQPRRFSDLFRLTKKTMKMRKRRDTSLLSLCTCIYVLEKDNHINIINCFQSILSFFSHVVSDAYYRVAQR